ncbi:hypothetical protein SAMN04489762_0371 [Terribacillus saccharophilus]|uniref:Uncharacterized protein n=1 Tax=Terribacillus saccharophilus TaxID=361277 RepID=A0AAX2EAD4_9BACI|nr:hypothetical protein [Terribacillus saccharophilus]MEC0290611.1 hypothetical protein [Terribacillus saccharophilus]SEM55447.1 hypothetical protein SAMN04489762_0371 [Terribacillus saccharophilus]
MFDMLQFLVPLAIAAIAFFFNAAAKKGDKENNDPRRTQPPVKNWQEKQQRTSKEQRQQKQKQVKAPELVQAEQKADELRKQAADAIQQVVGVQSASSVRKIENKQIAKPIRLKRQTRRQLAEQVLWSEILGEPRAKKPHRTYNKRVQ